MSVGIRRSSRKVAPVELEVLCVTGPKCSWTRAGRATDPNFGELATVAKINEADERRDASRASMSPKFERQGCGHQDLCLGTLMQRHRYIALNPETSCKTVNRAK